MTGKDLQKRIRLSGMTQKELAEKMGMHPSQFTTYFKQESVASGVVEKVAGLLGMSMGDFYGESNECNEHCERNAMLRNIATVAMQGLLVNSPHLDSEILKNKTYEQCIAELAVKQAMCMLDQFKKEGIDK